jgi:TrmH family RNA methyltransferase
MTSPQRVTARSNPLLVTLHKLSRDPAAYRKLGQVWIEGEHLCSAAHERGVAAVQVVFAESGWADPALRPLAAGGPRIVVVPDALFATVSALESPGRVGWLVDRPLNAAPAAGVASVVLDRVQDPGNVGSILRSAAALGVRQVLALEGTASLWSPKVLRAGMGAHFSLALVEGLSVEALDALALPLLAASPHAAQALPEAALPWPCAWAFGHEGRGVHPAVAARCALTVRIPQPGGEESLNVAAAAAICLYESSRSRSRSS